MTKFLFLQLWDGSVILIDIEMIVDIHGGHSPNQCIIQTVRDSWPVNYSVEYMSRFLLDNGYKILVPKKEKDKS